MASTPGAATTQRAQAIAESAVAGTPLGRFSTPQKVAGLVVFLARDRTANVTGSNMTIDGGMATTV
jgi:NAD(P)-dependent dehydrogenase (short-subunit alcohol dehydrogenase family)